MTDSSFLEKASTRVALKWISRLATLAILAFLFYRLRELGWTELWDALPTNPWFYILFVVIYLISPFAELLVYRQVWPIRLLGGMRAFLTKKVFNEEMVGYSGEVYLYWWFSQQGGISKGEAFRAVRDNNILSSVASMTVAFALVGVLAVAGQLQLEPILGRLTAVNILIVSIAVVAVAVVAVNFRRHLFALPRLIAAKILGIHYGRLLLVHGLLTVQWAAGAPGIDISVWLTYLCIFIVLNRIPFLPSKDLFFLGASVELSSLMGVATTSVAGMLVASSVLVRVTNVLVFIATRFAGPGSNTQQLDSPPDVTNQDSEDV